MKQGPRVLLFDIETAPILAYCWGIFDQNIALNQIHTDWHVLSWAAKWLNDPPSKVMYMGQKNAKNIENDKKILQGIWKLLDEADIVITQNGISFDQKKLNARFLLNGMQPPSSFKHIDTLRIAKKHFAMTSNKLEYMADKLNVKYKKLKHKKFPGFEMWQECLKGNKEAWDCMEKYNKYDVLVLEEVYKKLIPWENSINFNIYRNEGSDICTCGSSNLMKNGFYYSSAGKFTRYRCRDCGKETRGKTNLLTVSHRKSLKLGTVR
jgi:hypothetical protein